MTTQSFDHIIVGAGCAGLSLLVRMIESGKFEQQKILLLDRVVKNRNDRTWCFWEKGEGYFENIVYHQWPHLQVKHPAGDIALNVGAYHYKMIRGLHFYEYCFNIIQAATNVTVLYQQVDKIDTATGVITCGEEQFVGNHLFSSVLLQQPVLQANEFYLLQHFMGWFIETEGDCFIPDTAQLMNFKVSQEKGCTFVYVLPISSRKALIEYTLFSENELPEEEYTKGLATFIREQLQLLDYTITETEKGIIPMTNLHFPQQEGKLTYIGTASGQTKASTGYTFQFIQKQATAIVEKLALRKQAISTAQSKRFHFYDGVLLRILYEKKIPGADVFYRMFQRNKASQIFKFLDNETSLPEEIQIMNTSQKKAFIPAAIKEML